MREFGQEKAGVQLEAESEVMAAYTS